jgi:hypothetical protein
MGDIIQEVFYHMPERLMWYYIFLSTVLAIVSLDNGAAVKTVLLFPLRYMRHCKFLLKNKYKKYKKPFFFVTEQLR